MRRRLRSAAFPLHRHSLPQLVVDAALVAAAYYLAFWLRFGDELTARHYHPYVRLLDATLPWVALGTVAILALWRVYQRRWRYFSQRDVAHLLRAVVVDAILLVAVVAVVHPVHVIRFLRLTKSSPKVTQSTIAVGIPLGVAVLYPALVIALLVSARLLARAIYDRKLPGWRVRGDRRSVLVVGAGEGGRLVCRELLRNSELGVYPVGFVDDDPLKQRLRFDGVRVRGTTRELPRVLDDSEPDEVIIAIPSAPGELRMRVVTACRGRGIPVRTLPTVFELLSGTVDVARTVREVRVEDVLGREPVHMPLERVGSYLRDAVVLVTGAGGSIGSELCRQIALAQPRRLVLVDHAEDNMFNIVRELEEVLNVPAVDARAGTRGLQGGGADPRGADRGAAEHRLPRGRLQARRPDGAQRGRGDPQQRDRHARRRARSPGSSAWTPSCSSRPTRR